MKYIPPPKELTPEEEDEFGITEEDAQTVLHLDAIAMSAQAKQEYVEAEEIPRTQALRIKKAAHLRSRPASSE